MNQKISLRLYNKEKKDAIHLIKNFWKVHNNYEQNDTEALKDLNIWTSEGHRFWFICLDDTPVGFLHLGNRGGKPDWIEDLFVEPAHQNQRIGTYAIQTVVEEVRTYSDSLYIEASARNQGAIRLYQKLGFNCLNTVTLRHDFDQTAFDTIRNEKIYDLEFEIRKPK